MKINKDSIASLEIPDDLKADLAELFGSIESKENELATLRTKVPTDSQKVVESVDFDKYTAATKELEQLKLDLQRKLDSQKATSGMFDLLFPFDL